MQRIKFDAGEKRHVRLLIHAAQDAPFKIKEASWSLVYAGEELAAGECEIDDHIIDAYIEAPAQRTGYLLVITYLINDETLVEQLEMAVV